MIITILQAILLGLIQGATEFIPVSSSAHLIIVPWLFGWEDPALTSLTFDVALHIGTLVAVLAFFASDWMRLIKAWFMSVKERKVGTDPDRRLAWFVVIGTIPGAIAGILFESKIETLFHQPGVPIQASALLVMAAIIAVMGAALLIADRLARHLADLGGLSLKNILIIGFSQALAIFPGVSRSGSTITAGLAMGLKRETAARFSFLLSAPIIAGAGAKSLLEIYQKLKIDPGMKSELIYFPIGFIAAAISGYFCIRFLLRYLQNHSTNLFVYYRWAIAALIIIVALLRPVA